MDTKTQSYIHCCSSSNHTQAKYCKSHYVNTPTGKQKESRPGSVLSSQKTQGDLRDVVLCLLSIAASLIFYFCKISLARMKCQPEFVQNILKILSVLFVACPCHLIGLRLLLISSRAFTYRNQCRNTVIAETINSLVNCLLSL